MIPIVRNSTACIAQVNYKSKLLLFSSSVLERYYYTGLCYTRGYGPRFTSFCYPYNLPIPVLQLQKMI